MIGIFDLETQALSSDPGPDGRPISWSLDRRGLMGISWGCMWCSDGTMHHYCWEEIKQMAERLERCSLVVGYNGKSFDLPLLSAIVGREVEVPSHCDLMEIVQASLGHRLSLDDLAAQNISRKKSGYGGHAPTLYREQRYGALATYCARDVELTRDLYFLATSRGMLYAPRGRTIITPARWLQGKGMGQQKQEEARP